MEPVGILNASTKNARMIRKRTNATPADLIQCVTALSRVGTARRRPAPSGPSLRWSVGIVLDSSLTYALLEFHARLNRPE